MPLLEDPSAEVRRALILALSNRAREIPPAFLEEIVFSPYEDVREGSLRLARRLPDAKAAPLLFDLALDDSVAIRLNALEDAARRALPGWHELLARTLDDPSLEIARGAAEILFLHGGPEGWVILRGYLQEQPESPLAAFIRARLGLFSEPRPTRENL